MAKGSTKALNESLLFQALMEHFSERIYFKDLQSRFLYGSRTFLQLFGLKTLSELQGKTDFDFFSELHARKAFDDEQEIIRSGLAKLDMEEVETWPDSTLTWANTSKAPFRDEFGIIIGTFGISRDVTAHKLAREALEASEARLRQVSEELSRVNQALEELTFTDPLTALKNRRFLASRIPEDIALVQRAFRNSVRYTRNAAKNVNLLFLMVDIDHFKRINDDYGHLAGDLVLKEFAEILSKAARTTDTVARVGGEEFLVVTRHTSREDARVVAERIRASVEAHAFVLGDQTIRCTCSVGFSVYPLLPTEPEAFSWEQIVDIADHCLYSAKDEGRNAWVGLVPEKEAPSVRACDLPSDMTKLVHSGSLPLIRSLKAPALP